MGLSVAVRAGIESRIRRFECGYSPRCLALSRDGALLYVGCKDGSITRIDLGRARRDPEGAAEVLRPWRDLSGWPPGVRSIHDLGGGRLLFGDDYGAVHVFDLETEELASQGGLAGSGTWKPVTAILGLDSRRLGSTILVSSRNGVTHLYRAGVPLGRPLTVPLEGVSGVLGALPVRAAAEDRWVLVGESGQLWLFALPDGADPPRLEELTGEAWQDSERPGFLSDLGRFPHRSASPSGAETGFYMTTDAGVFLALWKDGEPGERLRLRPLPLPGISGMCMAVSRADLDGRRLLCISDLAGDVQLFEAAPGTPEPEARWERSVLRLDGSHAMSATSVLLPGLRQECLAIAHATRDDRAIVAFYTSGPELSEGDLRGSASAVLGADTAAALETWRDRWLPGVERLEAALAALVERAAAEDPNGFADFLGSPRAALAAEVLQRTEPMRRAATVLCWTFACSGAIYRSPEERRERLALGLIRWLRRLEETWRTAFGGQAGEEAEAFERAIQHARKWCLFGSSYLQRRRIGAPLWATALDDHEDRRLDALVFENNLFARKYDEEARMEAPPGKGGTPWDLSSAHLPGRREIVAVGLADGTVHVTVPPAGPWALVPASGERAAEGRLLLGTIGGKGDGKVFLLLGQVGEGWRLLQVTPPRPESSPRPPGDRKAQRQDREVLQVRLEDGAPLTAGRVTALLHLGSGEILFGLENGEGIAVPGRLRIEATPEGRLQIAGEVELFPPLPSGEPESRWVQKSNHITALDVLPSGTGSLETVLGCSDGQIWRLPLGGRGEPHPTLLARLGSPVQALCCTAVEYAGRRSWRIVAGGADGTILAFESLSDDGDGPSMTTLWATQEEGPVASLLASPTMDPAEALVVALMESGRLVLFSDRSTPETPEDSEWPRQTIVPGSRLGRIQIGASVLGATLLGLEEAPAGIRRGGRDGLGALLRLAIATERGDLRVLTFHCPDGHPSRKQAYRHLHGLWRALLEGQGRMPAEGFSFRLREAEGMAAASPTLPAVLAREILWHDGKGVPRQSWYQLRAADGKPDDLRGWLPTYAVPIADLDHAWTGGELARIGTHLRQAMREARRLDDFALFKTFLRAVLVRINHQLYAAAQAYVTDQPGDTPLAPGPLADLYEQILTALDDAAAEWFGDAARRDVYTHVVLAKHLVNGDLFWRIGQAYGREQRESASLGALEEDSVRGPFGRILKARLTRIHRLMGLGNPLVALETLRAANFALLRAACRLGRDAEAGWLSLKGYFEAVGDSAKRIARSGKGDIGEALAHEISRAYALGVVLAPGSALHVATRLGEVSLPAEIVARVDQQIELASRMLDRPIPREERELVAVAVLPERHLEDYHQALDGYTAHRSGNSIPFAGSDNLNLIAAWRPFHTILEELAILAAALEAGGAGLDLSRLAELPGELAKAHAQSLETFGHSHAFWQIWCRELARTVEPAGNTPAAATGWAEEPVRPDVVLLSPALARWARAALADAEQRLVNQRLFQPHGRFYQEILSRIERVAEGFRTSSGLQKTMVLGVLNHGLMEMLDEHLLELREVAQALNPSDLLPAGGSNGARRSARSVASHFGELLALRAADAEVIPKNLRSLQGLLGAASPAGARELAHRGEPPWLVEGFASFRWPQGFNHGLEPWERAVLRIVLQELESNHLAYGRRGAEVAVVLDGRGRRVFDFPYDPGEQEQNEKRITAVAATRFQRPVEWNEQRQELSHGLGLYLANLAAGMIGWRLAPEPPRDGIWRIALERIDRVRS